MSILISVSAWGQIYLQNYPALRQGYAEPQGITAGYPQLQFPNQQSSPMYEVPQTNLSHTLGAPYQRIPANPTIYNQGGTHRVVATPADQSSSRVTVRTGNQASGGTVTVRTGRQASGGTVTVRTGRQASGGTVTVRTNENRSTTTVYATRSRPTVVVARPASQSRATVTVSSPESSAGQRIIYQRVYVVPEWWRSSGYPFGQGQMWPQGFGWGANTYPNYNGPFSWGYPGQTPYGQYNNSPNQVNCNTNRQCWNGPRIPEIPTNPIYTGGQSTGTNQGNMNSTNEEGPSSAQGASQ